MVEKNTFDDCLMSLARCPGPRQLVQGFPRTVRVYYAAPTILRFTQLYSSSLASELRCSALWLIECLELDFFSRIS